MRLDVGAFEDSFSGRDIVFYSETHQTPGQALPHVSGYRWESASRQETRSELRGRGSGGVAVLYREELQPMVHIVRRDAHARYMWVRLRPETGRYLYIAICYFPPNTSVYAAPRGQSPFAILDEDIWEFSKDGDVMILGDFNARTTHHQSVFYDTSEEMLRELDTTDMGLARVSQDGEHTEYGRFLIEMGSMHGLAILNGMQSFPQSSGFTCFPHRHGASIVDYVMATPCFIQCIEDFVVGPRPVGIAVDHAILSLTLAFSYNIDAPTQTPSATRYRFTRETDSVYTDEIYARLCGEEPERPLHELTQILTETLHLAAAQAFPHSQPSRRPSSGKMPQNSWYDEECKETRATLQREVHMGTTTHRQSRITFRRLVRRKKRAYLAQLERDLYQLFLSQDSGEAWRLFREHSPTPAITSTDTWGEYATSLYTVPDQTSLPHPEECPHTCTFFTEEMVRKAIDRMKAGRACDHDGLVAEHFMHARDMLAEFLAWMFNRAMYEGFPDTWSMSTIVPIFKSGDPMLPGNYRTIMVGHTLAKIYASIIEHELSRWAEREGIRASG